MRPRSHPPNASGRLAGKSNRTRPSARWPIGAQESFCIREGPVRTIGGYLAANDRQSCDEAPPPMALLEQREWLRVTLSSIGDAVVTADADGAVTFLNTVAQSLTGWTHDEAAGVPLETVVRIVKEESREPAENPAARALREGTIVGLANHSLLIARDGNGPPTRKCADSRRVRLCVRHAAWPTAATLAGLEPSRPPRPPARAGAGGARRSRTPWASRPTRAGAYSRDA